MTPPSSPSWPRTALDIVERVPGFQLDLGGTQTNRTASMFAALPYCWNVVINGACR